MSNSTNHIISDERSKTRPASNGVNHWLSRRHWRYIRSLVYMLQASEYNIVDFFKWHERVKDFRNVEKRKHLVFTPKTIILFTLSWFTFLATISGAAFIFYHVASPWNYLLSALLVFEAPLIVMASLLFFVVCMRFVQYPIEQFLIARTKRRLSAHRGVKIAIAGSFGKTSMREILKTVLSEGRKVAAPGESYNTPLGIARFVKELEGDEDVLIFELGEYYPGDVRKLAQMIQPEWGIVTGVNEAHLEKFGVLEKTADTIFELADYLREENHSQVLENLRMIYVNGENKVAREKAKKGSIMYTREGAGEWRVENAKTDLSGTTCTLVKDATAITARSGLLGFHMLGPLAVAADVALRLGLTCGEIERGLAKTKPFAHRLEPKQWPDDVTFIDDSYNGNPDGARAAIEFLSSLKGPGHAEASAKAGRRFYITPGLVEAGPRAKEVHEEIGKRLARSGIEKVVLIHTSVSPYMEMGLKAGDFKGEILWYDDMPSCLLALRSLTIPGDIVLIQNDWPDQYM